MNYDALFSFLVFAEHLNLTHAARALHLSQPALHAQLRRLSDEVGAPLYERRGRSLVLTDAGELLAAHGREVRARGEEVKAQLRGERADHAVVLAAGQGACRYLLGPALRRFPKERWPLRVLTSSAAGAVQALRRAQADVAVAALGTLPRDLDTRRLWQVGQQVIVPKGHRLATRARLRLKDLSGEPLVVAPAGSAHREMLESQMANANTKLDARVEAQGWDLMLQCCRYGLGLAVVNDFCPAPRGFVGIPLRGMPQVSYYALTRPGLAHPGRERLLALVENSSTAGASLDTVAT